ncbi:hypothetical protein L3Q82_015511 [Scortum barcoo]|uniref:Uncharacterized protein n=1 Tax=Scortum barcoo TaxID=214431 RepID=A0ACB8VPS6_9TELE|nr:hypothetical protein L3Q82_015511 [Scortum barcoo]
MSSWPSSDASAASVPLTAPELQPGQTLYSSSAGYSILEFIGEGCFGKVAKCQTLSTKETVAVKIVKQDTDFIQDTEKEVSMLETISVLNPDHTNVVKFFECFEHRGQTCLVFEMLDRNLYDVLEERQWKPLSLNEIRPIAQQLLVALDALKGLGVLHTDKPDNIMFASKQDEPIRLKLIDFGTAILASKAEAGMELQPIGYRAPEVALGLPFTEALDVWGVGCILAFLYLAENLFPVECQYQMMKCMVEVLGQPEDHMLRAGKYTQYFFSEVEAADGATWRLMTPEEYAAANNMEAEERNSFIELPSSLDELVHIYPEWEAAQSEDRRAFVDVLKQMLHLDGDLRISPHQALQHPFIRTPPLTEHADSRADDWTVSPEPVDGTNSPEAVRPEQESASGFQLTGLQSGSDDDDPDTCSSDGESSSLSLDEDLSTWSFTSVSSLYSDEDFSNWPSFADLCLPPSAEDSSTLSSDGELSSLSGDEDAATDEAKDCCEDAPAAGSSDGGRLSSSHDDDPAVCEAESMDCSAAASDPPSRTTKILKRTRRFFRRMAAAFCCCCRPTVEE